MKNIMKKVPSPKNISALPIDKPEAAVQKQLINIILRMNCKINNLGLGIWHPIVLKHIDNSAAHKINNSKQI